MDNNAISPDETFRLVAYAGGEQEPDEISPQDFDALKAYLDYKSHYIDMGERKYMIDPVTYSRAYIFGGGHIGYEMAIVLDRLDFHTTIIDDREEYASVGRFPLADACVVSSFDAVCSKLDIDENSYIVIVTRGHIHDETVLEQALRTSAKYIGMIGSRTKRDSIYGSLLSKGFTQDDINRVHSPIGLAIGAHTPGEIAVSIAAEMIQVRAKG